MAQVRSQLRRRLLISYRLDADVAAGLLPAGFRPQLVDGSAVAGVCVLGLTAIRPGFVGPRLGLRSENAAHRMAVEWDEGGQMQHGVFVFQRHSSSWMPVALGGRAFPGVHRHAAFDVADTADTFSLRMRAPDAQLDAEVALASTWTSTLFETLEEASAFYEGGRVGWSRRHDGASVESIALASEAWRAEAGALVSLRSSFFDALPQGSAVFDHVVVMRDQPLVMRR